MKKGNLTGGLILILLGVWFLAVQLVPQLKIWAAGQWTLMIIGIGVIFLLISILSNIPGLSIPAFIVGGIGGLLYYQNVTGDWGSWAYAWTLIPGFVGMGLLFFSLQSRDKGARTAGFILLFISAALFFIFGSLLGVSKQIVQYWPIMLIILGANSMLRAVFGQKKEPVIEASSPVETKKVTVEFDIEGEEDES